ncbi:hypothetical protein BH11BAC4_BH11BAC4_13670 [soil metagenome]
MLAGMAVISYIRVYEAVYSLVFSLIRVSAGIRGIVVGQRSKLRKFSGGISFPFYYVLYPFIYIYKVCIYTYKPSPAQIVPVAIGLFICFMMLSF